MHQDKDAVTGGGSRMWAACAAAFTLVAGCAPPEGGERPQSLAALETSLAGLEAVARSFPAPDDRPLGWPQDHAPHAQQFTESWLVAGLLRGEDGRRYGFQLLLQRVVLQADDAARDSAWAASAAWQGAFSIEPEHAPRVAAERFSREALGLAGANAREQVVSAWLEDWRIEIAPDAGTGRVLGAASGGALELTLRLPATVPAGTAADARRGYWWPGLDADGMLQIGGRSLAVRGSALLDRSWGQAPPVGRGQLALARVWTHTEEGTAMHCEALRRRGGGGVPLGGCTEFPSGRSLDRLPEPTEAAATAARGGQSPLEWNVPAPGTAVPGRWAPLAQPGDVGTAWSGVIVPAAEDAGGDQWGLLSLSNFAAP
ncbi:carotenoid 1,2-hydratase [Thioalkalivibrio sp. XN279]|uniref:carotenoid 1,2-hydratase n=1 Tax=Thioalkalivibrio sp. XN279 TaxID=2714953 RepID=UPI00140DDA58|nr:carotenoid 1,2-hydratase [Thioalkalivibrio sp. XN279]NHA13615.1 carotenoid 1,2-hydratase [Thioalkalivibrio sp. XN279]